MAGEEERPAGEGKAAPPPGTPGGEAEGQGCAYLGAGCFTAIAGAGGGAMLAVGLAHIVGAARKCPIDAETGAPCNWLTYAVRGALVGAILLSSLSIWLLRRSRARKNTNRG